MLDQLIEKFAGKRVRITHTNPRVKPVAGVCKTIRQIPGSEDHFDIELNSGSKYSFCPEVVTNTSVDGKLRAFVGGRRKIEIIDLVVPAE